MTPKLRILHLENDALDADLVALHLKSDHWIPDLMRVTTYKDFSAALDKESFQIILADNSGPSFNGKEALALARKKLPQTPFVFVSGTIEGDEAAWRMKNEADGFVLKDQLSKLPSVIDRAIQDKTK